MKKLVNATAVKKTASKNKGNSAADTTGFKFPAYVGDADRKVLQDAFANSDLEDLFDESLPKFGSNAVLVNSVKAESEFAPVYKQLMQNYLRTLDDLPISTLLDVGKEPEKREQLKPSKGFVDSLVGPILESLSRVELVGGKGTEIVRNRILYACEVYSHSLFGFATQPGFKPVELEPGEFQVAAALMSVIHGFWVLTWRSSLVNASIAVGKKGLETIDAFEQALEAVAKKAKPRD